MENIMDLNFIAGICVGGTVMLFLLAATISRLSNQIKETTSKYEAILLRNAELEVERRILMLGFNFSASENQKLHEDKLKKWGVPDKI
jgi:hypothetical protein